MTFRELIEAVDRDMQSIAPNAYHTVQCHFTRYNHMPTPVIMFGIYHDETVLGGTKGEWYEGDTPDEAYDKFLAAVLQPAAPSLAQALDLCDTPVAAGIALAACRAVVAEADMGSLGPIAQNSGAIATARAALAADGGAT